MNVFNIYAYICLCIFKFCHCCVILFAQKSKMNWITFKFLSRLKNQVSYYLPSVNYNHVVIYRCRTRTRNWTREHRKRNCPALWASQVLFLRDLGAHIFFRITNQSYIIISAWCLPVSPILILLLTMFFLLLFCFVLKKTHFLHLQWGLRLLRTRQ